MELINTILHLADEMEDSGKFSPEFIGIGRMIAQDLEDLAEAKLLQFGIYDYAEWWVGDAQEMLSDLD